MDEATAGVGADLGDHGGILWEEDEDVMMELGESMGEDWGQPRRKKSRKKVRDYAGPINRWIPTRNAYRGHVGREQI